MPTSFLFITTTRAVWLLETATGDAWEIDSGQDVYYGVTTDGAHLYVAARRAPYGTSPRGQANVILRFDENLRYLEPLCPPFPLRDVHQIVYSAGQLWIAATFDDCVVTHHLSDKVWSRWMPFGPSITGRPDEHHINSVQCAEGSILLAGTKPQGWFAHFGSDRSPRDGGKKFLGLKTHNVWQEAGDAWVCSTDEGALLSSRGARREVAPDAWLRGICRDGPMTYVGVSQHLKGNRGFSDSSVVVLDEDGGAVDCFSFHGYGMIHDIRALDRADVTHGGIPMAVDIDLIRRTKKRHETSRQLVTLLNVREEGKLPLATHDLVLRQQGVSQGAA